MRSCIIFGLAGMWVLCCGCAKRVAAIPVKAVPASQTVFARQVREARIAGEGNQEIRVLRQRLAVEPGSIELRMELAKHYENAGYLDLALEHVRLARNLDRGSAQLTIEEARLLMKQDLPDEAAKVLRAAAEAPEAAAEMHAWLGIALDEAGDLAGGEAAHRRALALAPDDDTILNNLGYNLYRQGRPEEAIRYLESALAQNRENALARSNLARAMVARAATPDAAGAVAHWSAAVDPASAHNNLAAALIEQGSYEQARRELNAALAIERKHLAAWNNLRLVSELDGQPATVLAVRRTGRWQRFAGFWKHAFGGGEPSGNTNESPNQRASR
jgi:Flp pilus assembly protein TadD